MEMVKVVKDISSDIAVLSKKGSTVLKDLREKNERSKMRERFWELAGSQLGNVLKVEKKEVAPKVKVPATPENVTSGLLSVIESLSKQHVGEVKDVKQALCYVCIDNTIETLNNFILSKLDESYYDKLTNFKNDFIFICYFLGNDFIPHIPSIDIKKEGMDIIINAYIHSLERTGEYIIEKIIIVKNKNISLRKIIKKFCF